MAGNGIIGETGKYKEENRYIHGKIVKGIAGFYYVYGEDNSGKGGRVYECKAKGIFRKENKKPLVGDDVRMEILEEETASADSWDDISKALDQVAAPEEPARRIRWESRGKTPPADKLILTYELTNAGPVYQAAIWTGSVFQVPGTWKELTGLRYTSWIEIPSPGSGESGEVAPPEQAEGQLVICDWMPGGTFPTESCEVVADFQAGEGTQIRQVCIYDGGNFYFRAQGRKGAKIDAELIRWMRLPPEE